MGGVICEWNPPDMPRETLSDFDYLSQKLFEDGATCASEYFLIRCILVTFDKDSAIIVIAYLHESKLLLPSCRWARPGAPLSPMIPCESCSQSSCRVWPRSSHGSCCRNPAR